MSPLAPGLAMTKPSVRALECRFPTVHPRRRLRVGSRMGSRMGSRKGFPSEEWFRRGLVLRLIPAPVLMFLPEVVASWEHEMDVVKHDESCSSHPLNPPTLHHSHSIGSRHKP